MPRPSSEAIEKRRVSSSRARSGSNSQPSREVRSGAGPVSGSEGAVSPGGHHDLGGTQAGEGLLDAILAQRLQHQLAGAQVHRGQANLATPRAPARSSSCCAGRGSIRPPGARRASPSPPPRGGPVPSPAVGPRPARRWRPDARRSPAAADTRRRPSPARRRAARRRRVRSARSPGPEPRAPRPGRTSRRSRRRDKRGWCPDAAPSLPASA